MKLLTEKNLCYTFAAEIITIDDNKNIHLKKEDNMRIDLDEWAKEYAKKKSKERVP